MARIIEQIEASMAAIRRIGHVFSIVLAVLIGCLCIIAVFSIFHIVRDFEGVSAPDVILLKGGGGIRLVPSIILMFEAGIILAILRGISSDIARGKSPFSLNHTRKIKSLGFLFFIGFLLSPLFIRGSIDVTIGSIGFECIPSSMLIVLPGDAAFDVGSLLCCFFCCAVSLFWQYGALLQEQSNDLV